MVSGADATTITYTLQLVTAVKSSNCVHDACTLKCCSPPVIPSLLLANALCRDALNRQLHPATRTFQALRIAINNEVGGGDCVCGVCVFGVCVCGVCVWCVVCVCGVCLVCVCGVCLVCVCGVCLVCVVCVVCVCACVCVCVCVVCVVVCACVCACVRACVSKCGCVLSAVIHIGLCA